MSEKIKNNSVYVAIVNGKNEAVQLRNYETQVYKLLERHLGSY